MCLIYQRILVFFGLILRFKNDYIFDICHPSVYITTYMPYNNSFILEYSVLLTNLFIVGIVTEAITGTIAAGRKQMDLFGVVLIACITALGGGSVRDLVLNIHPLTWVAHPGYIAVTSTAAIITIVLMPSVLKMMRVFLFLDALGLAAFVIIGAQKAMALKLSFTIVIISGALTGICGGMLRDILCNDIPLVLRRELYAIIALLGAALYWVLIQQHINTRLSVLITLFAIFLTRVIAILFHIEMPKLNYLHDTPETQNTHVPSCKKKIASKN